MHKMKRASLFLFAAEVFAGLILSPLVDAKDLSALQSVVTYAREDMDKAKTAHEANNQEVIRQQRIVETQKKQLAEESKRLEKAKINTVASQKLYLEARKKYEKAQAALDDMWGKK